MSGDAAGVFLVPGDPDCRHETTEYMGGDTGNNEYYECLDCHGVLIRRGDRDFQAVRAEQENSDEPQHPFDGEEGDSGVTAVFDRILDRLAR